MNAKTKVALRNFLNAAQELENNWDPALDNKAYPLPESFDEFYFRLLAWRDAAESVEAKEAK